MNFDMLSCVACVRETKSEAEVIEKGIGVPERMVHPHTEKAKLANALIDEGRGKREAARGER